MKFLEHWILALRRLLEGVCWKQVFHDHYEISGSFSRSTKQEYLQKKIYLKIEEKKAKVITFSEGLEEISGRITCGVLYEKTWKGEPKLPRKLSAATSCGNYLETSQISIQNLWEISENINWGYFWKNLSKMLHKDCWHLLSFQQNSSKTIKWNSKRRLIEDQLNKYEKRPRKGRWTIKWKCFLLNVHRFFGKKISLSRSRKASRNSFTITEDLLPADSG